MNNAKPLPADAPDTGPQKQESESTQAQAQAAGAAADADTKLKLHVNDGIQNEDVGFILDIPLRISVELGRTRLLVQDLLKLHKGSVLELNKLAGEPLEVLVNDRVVAKGEVIVINEKFGIRLIDIVSHSQRIRELGQ